MSYQKYWNPQNGLTPFVKPGFQNWFSYWYPVLSFGLCSLFAFPVCKMYNLHCTDVLYLSYMYCKVVLTMLFCMLYNCLYSEQCKHVLYVFYSTHMMFCMTYKCLYSVSVNMYCMWCPTPVYTMYSVHMYCMYCKYSHDVLYALPEIVIQFLFFTRRRYTQTSSTRIYLCNQSIN